MDLVKRMSAQSLEDQLFKLHILQIVKFTKITDEYQIQRLDYSKERSKIRNLSPYQERGKGGLKQKGLHSFLCLIFGQTSQFLIDARYWRRIICTIWVEPIWILICWRQFVSEQLIGWRHFVNNQLISWRQNWDWTADPWNSCRRRGGRAPVAAGIQPQRTRAEIRPGTPGGQRVHLEVKQFITEPRRKAKKCIWCSGISALYV